MKHTIILSVIILVLISCNGPAENKGAVKAGSFDYLGQAFTADSVPLFAPGTISDSTVNDRALAVSPLGDELFYARGIWPNAKIMYMRKEGDGWTGPDTAEFSKDCWATEPAFSPDGRYLYFSASIGKTDISNYNIWRIEKSDDGWSEPVPVIDIEGDKIWEFHPSVTQEGHVYFCYWDAEKNSGDIYMSECNDAGCSEPVKLPDQVNSGSSDVDPFVDPGTGFIIFASDRPGGLGDFDQYISFRGVDGVWSELRNMGPEFNTDKADFDMDVSPDGKYLFTYTGEDVYWSPAVNFKDIFK